MGEERVQHEIGDRLLVEVTVVGKVAGHVVTVRHGSPTENTILGQIVYTLAIGDNRVDVDEVSLRHKVRGP